MWLSMGVMVKSGRPGEYCARAGVYDERGSVYALPFLFDYNFNIKFALATESLQ